MQEGAHRKRKVMKERNKLVLRGDENHRKMYTFQLETNGTHFYTITEPGGWIGKLICEGKAMRGFQKVREI